MTAEPTVVSLFTGAGGLDCGLERAGLRTVAATDFDARCVRTLRAARAARISVRGLPGRVHLDGALLVHADIADLEASDVTPAGMPDGWRPDLLAGGPPCQPFSSAGSQRGVDDPRGRLFEHFVRLADELRPRVVLFENVQGLITAKGPSGQPGEVLEMVRAAFEAIGYATRFDLLNSADYGAAQRRQRCFMLASDAWPLPPFPAATHTKNPRGGLPVWRSMRSALAGLPEPDEADVTRPSSALERQLDELEPGSGLKSMGAKETTRPGGHWGYRQGCWVADPLQPARTVTASSSQDWVRDRCGRLRRLTVAECARLQGFPDCWPLAGPVSARYRQVGNAVPAHFGEALGSSVIAHLAERDETRRPESADMPQRFHRARRNTQREHERNAASRAAHKATRAGR